ncbi:GNAT family N-acetyltransferase [Brucella sp. IR073]|uniref:GNAT family N-acetyltransferase n=1 Tax=unclassified Brucella TaxID=2632610 RepID=UPI003B986BB0
MPIKIGKPSDFGFEVDDVCRFYNEHWKRKIALGDSAFYRWQFIDTPVNTGIDECCVAVLDDQIVGVMGLNARDFYAGGKKLDGAELTTWVVAEEHRNKGSGPAMIGYLKNRFDVMIGMGISHAALPVYLRSGFRYIKAIPRHVHVIHWDTIKDAIKADPLAYKYAKAQILLADFALSRDFDPGDVDKIYDNFSKEHNSFSRKHEDIKWRYDNHPYFKYSHFIVNGSCHVCVRIDKDVDGFVMAHCVDIFGDAASYPSAVSAAIHYAGEQGASAIDFFSTNARLNAVLGAMGLFSTLDHDFFKFPHLFHPVEIRDPATTSLILWAKEGLADFLDTSRLHITKQDADFDRPTIYGMKP